MEVRWRGRGAGPAKENRHMEVMTEELTLMKVKKDVDIEGERREGRMTLSQYVRQREVGEDGGKAHTDPRQDLRVQGTVSTARTNQDAVTETQETQ